MKLVNVLRLLPCALILSMGEVLTADALSLVHPPSDSIIETRDSLEETTWADMSRPGTTSPNANLLERQWRCYDPGYGRCPGTNYCCPIGGRCCSNRTCCRSGYYCVTGGCCPIGKVCSGPGRRCTLADSYPCPNDNVCCPYGTTCGRNTFGQPVCRDIIYEVTTRTSRTTVIIHTTSTIRSASTTPRPSTKEPDIETDIETDFDTPTDAPTATPAASDPLSIPSQSVYNGTTTTSSRPSVTSLAPFTSTPISTPGSSNKGTQERTIGVAFGLVLIAGALMI